MSNPTERPQRNKQIEMRPCRFTVPLLSEADCYSKGSQSPPSRILLTYSTNPFYSTTDRNTRLLERKRFVLNTRELADRQILGPTTHLVAEKLKKLNRFSDPTPTQDPARKTDVLKLTISIKSDLNLVQKISMIKRSETKKRDQSTMTKIRIKSRTKNKSKQ